MKYITKVILIIVLFLIIFLTFYFADKIIIRDKPVYKFPDDYNKINCNETFVGDITDATCYQTPNLDSFILKTSEHWTVYSMEFYNNENWEKRNEN